jgi:uncharacterized membrane-anchored protein
MKASEQPQKLSPETEFTNRVSFQDYLKATEPKSTKPVAFWRFMVPLMIQTGLILLIPTQGIYTQVTGSRAFLQTASVDPSNILRNNSLTLDYNISRNENLRRLPGWQQLVRRFPGRNRQSNALAQGTKLYVILQQQIASAGGIPRAWKPIRISATRPNFLPTNQLALQGEYRDGFITYGLESYYIPEDQRQQINNDIAQVQRNRFIRQRQPILVEVKVDEQGNAVPVSIWVRDRNYRF